jgi:hypothetical protein
MVGEDMKCSYLFALIFGVIGFVLYVFGLNSFPLFGLSINYPHILDIFFLVIGGYFVGFLLDEWNDEDDDNDLLNVFFDFAGLFIVMVILLAINLIAYFVTPAIVYPYIILGITLILGITITILCRNSVFDSTEFSSLIFVGVTLGLSFGGLLGAGITALVFISVPTTALSAKRLFKHPI